MEEANKDTLIEIGQLEDQPGSKSRGQAQFHTIRLQINLSMRWTVQTEMILSFDDKQWASEIINRIR